MFDSEDLRKEISQLRSESDLISRSDMQGIAMSLSSKYSVDLDKIVKSLEKGGKW